MTTVLPDVTTSAPAPQYQEPMLVAVRDPATDRPAVDWAAHRAASLNAPLTVLHAINDPSLVPPGTSYGDQVIAGRELVEHEAARVTRRHPGLRVGTYLHGGGVVEALLGLSASAPMIVVGADRSDPVSGDFAGSVALLVALNSSAPVVVVPRGSSYPRPEQGRGGVVVGVDGSEASRAALVRAAEEAETASRSLTAVTVLGSSPERMPIGASQMLVMVRKVHPKLPVRWVVDDIHSPLQALTMHATGAELLVIGRHGAGARSISSLGSVTHTLLLDPPCPTLVLTRHEPELPAGTAVQGLG